MFEQSLYETEPVATPLENGDLFHNYEIRNWEFSPRLYKILGMAAFVNVLALLVFAQTSVLTMKGCDSPLVGRVCDVLDTVYIGSILFGTQREYVDAAYDKTDLGDAEITFVDVSGDTPPLSYPDGYFQIANPDQYQATLAQANNPTSSFDMSGFPTGINTTPPSMGNSLIDTKPNIPKANPNVITGDLPTIDDRTGLPDTPISRPKGPGLGRPRMPKISGTPKATPDPTIVADKKNDPPKVTTADPAAAAEDAQEDKFGVYINKRPLRDQAKTTLDQLDAKKIQLAAPFKVSVAGTLGLGKDQKTVVIKNPKPLPVDKNFPNDPAMVKLVQDWILAVGDAGWLGYLDRLDDKKKLKSKRVIVTVEQNDNEVLVNISSELPSENEAKTAASGLNALLGLAAGQTKDDEQTFLKSATSSFEGNMVILKVSLPKPIAQDMINRKLAEEQEKKAQQPKPSSSSLLRQTEKTAKK